MSFGVARMMVSLSVRLARRLARTAVFASLALGAPAEAADSVAGTWWFRIAGRDEGALLLQLAEPSEGSAQTEVVGLTLRPGFGFSRELGTFFTVAAGQLLGVSAKGGVSGTLVLADPDSLTALGALTIARGKVGRSPGKLRLTLIGTITPEGGAPRKVTLHGTPVATGFELGTNGFDGILTGRGVANGVIAATIAIDPGLGAPAYTIEGHGRARVDGAEVPEVSIAGRAMLAPNGRLVGLLEDSSHFGTGELSGTIRERKGQPSKLRLEARADRTVQVRADLTPLVLSGSSGLDFGAVALDGPPIVKTFFLANRGRDALSGSATFESGSSSAFSIVGSPTYGPLRSSDAPVPITVQFDPAASGAHSAVLRYGALPSASVTLSGSTTEDAFLRFTDHPFASLAPSYLCYDRSGTSVHLTVLNTGASGFEGVATLEGSDLVAFSWEGGEAVRSQPFVLAPSESTVIAVQLRCPSPASIYFSAGATLRLVGEGGASRFVGFRRAAIP